jgi:hypothetical protein
MCHLCLLVFVNHGPRVLSMSCVLALVVQKTLPCSFSSNVMYIYSQ